MSDEMLQPKSLEETIQELKQQNVEIVKTSQFWRLEYRRVEEEKFMLMKENNDLHLKRKQSFHKIKQKVYDLECHFRSYVSEIKSLMNDYDIFDDSVHLSLSSIPHTPTRTPGSVHHVRPMIQGITLKTPILRVSKTNIDSLNTSGQNSVSHRSPMTLISETSPNLQRVTVSLTNMDNIVNNPISTARNTPKRKSGKGCAKKGSPRDRHAMEEHVQFTPCELSVSLSRIDSIIDKRSPENSPTDEANDSKEEYSERNNTSDECSQSYDNRNEHFEEDLYVEDHQKGDCLKYSSRLECIIEESEGDSNSLLLRTNSGKGLMQQSKRLQTTDEEDPLEGPSWKYDDNGSSRMASHSVPQKRDVEINYVTHRKKLVEDESLFETASPIRKVAEQVPDSTTEGKDGSALDPAPYHSTPNNPNKTITLSDSVQEASPNLLDISQARSKSKSIRSKKQIKVVKTAKRSSRGSLTRSKKGSKRTKSPESARSSLASSDMSSLTTADDTANQALRPKRGDRKVYTEIPLNKKLRRT